MKEQELNTLMSVVSDPIKNVYKIESRKDLEEIQRIIDIQNRGERLEGQDYTNGNLNREI